MEAPFVADTSILIDFFQGNPDVEFLRTSVEEDLLRLPTIVIFEILSGVKNENHLARRKSLVDACGHLPLTREVAEKAAEIFSYLREKGITIDIQDILIGATALTYSLPVVTRNVKHFRQIKGLNILATD